MKKRFAIFVLLIIVSTHIHALTGLELKVEAQTTIADGDYSPLWLNANKYGLSSLDTSNGYLRTLIQRPLTLDSAYRWGLSYGADIAVGYGMTSSFVVQQAFAEVRWLKGLLTVGSKEIPAELKNNELSSGSQCLGINARPIPQVRLALPDYVNIPGMKGWLGLKGHLSYGVFTDDDWQKDFTQCLSKHTENTLFHSKAGYLKLQKPNGKLSIEIGLEMACEFGGRSMIKDKNGNYRYDEKNKSNLQSFWRAFIPGGNDHELTRGEDQEYKGAEGNHVGAWTFHFSWNEPSWGISIYGDHYFEDISQMFHLDYDGYTTGSDWQKKENKRFLLYDLKDILIGLELTLPRCKWLSNVLIEYINTTYQSGPIFVNHTKYLPDHIGGKDNYYQHGIYTGWQHWGQVIGNPLYRSPLYNTDGVITSEDTRFKAFHFGLSGNVFRRLHYRLLGTIQKGFGTYNKPFDDPQRNFSMLVEADYSFKAYAGEWNVRCGLGMDRGMLLGDNLGIQATISKSFKL